MKKINTILFDLDGTLVNSNELIIYSFGKTVSKFIKDRNFSRNDLIEMIGPPLFETFENIQKDPVIIKEMIDYYIKTYKTNEFEFIELYPNTLEMLEEFYRKGYQLGIVTTKFRSSALPSIKHYGLDKFMSTYCFVEDIKNPKPSAEPIEFALNKLSNIQDVVMVGDNTGDIKAGFNANCLTCGIEWSIKRDLIKNLNPTFWISDYSELVNLVEKYNEEA